MVLELGASHKSGDIQMAKRSGPDLKLFDTVMGIQQDLVAKLTMEGKKHGLRFRDARWLVTEEGRPTLMEMVSVLAEARKPKKRKPRQTPVAAPLSDPPLPKSILGRFPNARIICEIQLRVDRTVKPIDLILATRCGYINEWMKTYTPEWQETGIRDETAVIIDMGANYEHEDSLAVIDALDGGKIESCPDRATIWTLSKDQPDLQREIWVMDPGTVSLDGSGGPCVAYLDGGSDRRGADLDRVAGGWDRCCRVLARRK